MIRREARGHGTGACRRSPPYCTDAVCEVFDMEYGIFQLPTFHPDPAVDSAALYGALADQARRAEALGFGSYWIAEHHFHGFGGMIPSPQIVIPAVAAQTRRL